MKYDCYQTSQFFNLLKNVCADNQFTNQGIDYVSCS